MDEKIKRRAMAFAVIAALNALLILFAQAAAADLYKRGSSGATVTTTVGTHTIYFKDVTGYTTPASQTVTLKSGDAKTGTAAYTVPRL